MTSDHPPPTRKRNQPSDLQQQLERDEIIQQNAAPVLGVAPVKRRRSSASSAEEHSSSTVEEKEQQSACGEKEVNLDGAPEGKLFLVTVKTRKELLESEEVAAESLKLDQLLQLKQQSANTKNAATDDDVDVAWGQEFKALDSLRRFAKYHQDEARRQLDNEVLKTLVLPAASSLRSAMARNALLCVQDLILELKAETANHLDIIVPVLLNRACSEKQFLRDLAREVLDTTLLAGANEKFLLPLLATSTTEKSAQVVSVAGLYVTKCIIRMDRQRLRKFLLEARGSFFDEMAAFLNCKVVECKAATRRTCQHSRRVIGNEEFVALVKESLSGSAQLDVLKASEIRQAAKSGHAKSSIRELMMQMKKQQQQQQKKVQSGGNDISVVVVAPPSSRSKASSTQAPLSL
ncbi:uncharacterized protein PITG_17632 [Phytophthora infestans T30-4]|uniref:CLASP N-terminal domain-containing protein n=2 Tax=Phytophthora infestans TaxID=4787 RepID=D0NWU4_PHYIT|nr:uncharacterized protein PITG_17632 [Phytophthora infestans T30-4]EEY67527.1 conserved hypothetical protein [Phytophthora infestans T30-4]KAF4038166.1 CLASP N terminal [Phytophthora infestans]|eukprot:XP_002896500.1 conserved hypothetical protein [Phytophthora infestans T30-4]